MDWVTERDVASERLFAPFLPGSVATITATAFTSLQSHALSHAHMHRHTTQTHINTNKNNG